MPCSDPVYSSPNEQVLHATDPTTDLIRRPQRYGYEIDNYNLLQFHTPCSFKDLFILFTNSKITKV